MDDFASTIDFDEKYPCPRQSFQDWYIVKKNHYSGAKKIVEACAGSPIRKPNALYVKAPEKYVVEWDHQETNGFEVIRDDWTDEDREKIKRFAKEIEKFEKYPKIVKWDAVQHSVLVVLVMSSSNAGSQLYGDEDPFHVVNSDEETSTTVAAEAKKKRNRNVKVGDLPTIECPLLEEFAAQVTETDNLRLISAASMAYLMRSREMRKELVQARAERDQLLIEKAKYNELDEKLKEYGNMHISKEDLHKWSAAFWFKMLSTGGMAAVIKEINMAATEYGGHGVAVAGLRRIKSEKPIKAKWFKQFLKKNSKKPMHEALVKAITNLSIEQLLLWELLCMALARMSVPGDVGAFLGDTATVLARGPGKELSIPEISEEYIGIELEDGDDVASEEKDTGNSGTKNNDPPVGGNTGGANGSTRHSHEAV
ncbi:OLC1v1025290C1 [Oldenlandia corymbosa var. corymbosa]|uniref:OLC1v1025290C1 n=1 Tax=Oldenlandia corymbosa var. corymbosa TaxID=529605 RepID=A0AAV1C7F2_OLDCO|nr:OLC1v1025290C1 [Oldenlandia corymbosa var. corymbosa]